MIGVGLLFLAIGVLALVLGWGTWWMAASPVALFFALGGFLHAKDI